MESSMRNPIMNLFMDRMPLVFHGRVYDTKSPMRVASFFLHNSLEEDSDKE